MTYPEIRALLDRFEGDRVSNAGRYAVGGGEQNPAICRVDGDRSDPILVPIATFRGILKDLCECVDARDRDIAALKAELAAHRST